MSKIGLIIYAKAITKDQLDEIKLKLRGKVSPNEMEVIKAGNGRYNLFIDQSVAEFFKE